MARAWILGSFRRRGSQLRGGICDLGKPFGTQYPKELRDILVRNGILNPDYTPNEATAQKLGWKLKEKDEVLVEERWWLSTEERKQLLELRHPRPNEESQEDQR